MTKTGGFGDGDLDQTLSGGYTFNGQYYPDGSIVENEYMLTVEDSQGNQYQLAAVSFQNVATDIRGFAYVGTQPPLGEQLTIVAAEDNANMSYAPICFTPGALIGTDRGGVAVETLVEGDRILTLDHGHQSLRMIIWQHFEFEPGPHPHKPILISKGAIGGGLPSRDLVVSPQHRILMRASDTQALVPAKALTGRRGIREMHGCRAADYIQLVLDRHEIILSNGAQTESFLPGEVALAALDMPSRRRVMAVMTPHDAVRPARPVLTVRQGRELFCGNKEPAEFRA